MLGKNCGNCRFIRQICEIGRYERFECTRGDFAICSYPSSPKGFVCDVHEFRDYKREQNFRMVGE